MEAKQVAQHMLGSGAAVGDDVGDGRVPAPGGAVREPSLPGPVVFVMLYLHEMLLYHCPSVSH